MTTRKHPRSPHIAADKFLFELFVYRSVRMRPLILAIALVALFAGQVAFAHGGRHDGSSHAAGAGKSAAQAGFTASTSSTDAGPRSDTRSIGNTATAPAVADEGKTTHHKPGRTPDEEEVQQAEH